MAFMMELAAALTKFRREEARKFGQARRAANDPATSPEKLRMWLTIIADAGEGWMMLAAEVDDSARRDQDVLITENSLLRRGMSPRTLDRVLKSEAMNAKRTTTQRNGAKAARKKR